MHLHIHIYIYIHVCIFVEYMSMYVFTFKAQSAVHVLGALGPRPYPWCCIPEFRGSPFNKACLGDRKRLSWGCIRGTWTSEMAKRMDPRLPRLSVLRYWAIVLGSFGGAGTLLRGTAQDPMKVVPDHSKELRLCRPRGDSDLE